MSAIDQKLVAARSRVTHLETELAVAKAVLDTLEDLVPVDLDASVNPPGIEEAKKRADYMIPWPLSSPVVRADDRSDLDAFFAGIPAAVSPEEAEERAQEIRDARRRTDLRKPVPLDTDTKNTTVSFRDAAKHPVDESGKTTTTPARRADDMTDLDAFFAGIPDPTSTEEATRWAVEKYQRDLVFYGLGWSDKDNAAFPTKNLRSLLEEMTPETRLQFYDKLPKDRRLEVIARSKIP